MQMVFSKFKWRFAGGPMLARFFMLTRVLSPSFAFLVSKNMTTFLLSVNPPSRLSVKYQLPSETRFPAFSLFILEVSILTR